jgi:hypothetical protein
MVFTVKNNMWIIESIDIRVDLTFPIFILFYRDLSVNKLTNIPDYAFVNLTNLIEL